MAYGLQIIPGPACSAALVPPCAGCCFLSRLLFLKRSLVAERPSPGVSWRGSWSPQRGPCSRWWLWLGGSYPRPSAASHLSAPSSCVYELSQATGRGPSCDHARLSWCSRPWGSSPGGQVTKISFTLTQSLSWPQEGDFIQYPVYPNSFVPQALHIGDADPRLGPVLAHPAVGLQGVKGSARAPKSKEK